VERLSRRIDKLLSAARFEAGVVTPHTEPTPAADLFRAARESLPTIARVRPLPTSVRDDTPDLLADPSLALEIVVNLIENAHAASPDAVPVELCAEPSSDGARVRIEVRDRGPGVPASHLPGLGMELARTLAVLSGGSVAWLARDGGGTVARLDLPAAPAVPA
jgi:signal transduction histidine kinase